MLKFFPKIKIPIKYVAISFILDNVDYMGYMGICPNPHCPCRDVSFSFDEKSKFIQIADDRSSYNFYVDLFDKKYGKINKDKNTSLQSKKIAKSFIKELIKDDWQKLEKEFFNYKHHIINTFNPEQSEFEFNFPQQAIEEESFMMGYHEIFPFAQDETFEDEQFTYLIDDQYCLAPECPCKSVALTFIPIKKDGNAIPKSQLSIRYDYQKNTYEKIYDASDKSFNLNMLVSQLLNSMPDYPDLLKTRHEKLKRLYKKCKRQNVESVVVPKQEKIGRNESCPCGSGKKYKYCCGR